MAKNHSRAFFARELRSPDEIFYRRKGIPYREDRMFVALAIKRSISNRQLEADNEPTHIFR